MTDTSLRPLPPFLRHYADVAINDDAQSCPIDASIDRVHYPTIGCPALIDQSAKQPLFVWVSLPTGEGPDSVTFALLDRHGQSAEQALSAGGAPAGLGGGPARKDGSRRDLWQLEFDVSGVRPGLYDLSVRWAAGAEIQPNAVRVFAEVTGKERVIFCGDSQYHVDNAECLERFIRAVNEVDAAWIALIGDGCDNAVKSKFHMLKLVLGAGPKPVECHYTREFADLAKTYLPRLNKPVVLVPGNHDGMTAYRDYSPGTASDTYLGPDDVNDVAYDGLHHYRRSIGPLHFAFDWGQTRYLCVNSFELSRTERLGYHAVVANWGGYVRGEQRAWIRAELEDAKAAGRGVVVLMHHDPRGGSEGAALGYYSDVRRYAFDSLADIAVSYARYIGTNASTWQQEWMKRPGDAAHLAGTKELLSLLVDHQVHAVIMGHDNENWVESYGKGKNVFDEIRAVQTYSAAAVAERAGAGDDVRKVKQLLEARKLDELVKLLESKDEEAAAGGEHGAPKADDLLDAAYERLTAEGKLDPGVSFAPVEIDAWKLRAKGPMHFIHVDDVGAYKHSRESHFADYGYVVAELRDGRPVQLRRTNLLGDANPEVRLDVV